MKNNRFFLIVLSLSLIVSFIVLTTGTFAFKSSINEWYELADFQKGREGEVPILLYHNIIPDKKNNSSIYALRKSDFLRQLGLIKKMGIEILPLKDLFGSNERSPSMKQKSIVLTFDDDFNNFYSVLFPLIKEKKFPVTLFIYTEGISKYGRKLLTWDKLREMDRSPYVDIQCHSRRHLDLAGLPVDGDLHRKIYDETLNARKIIEMELQKKIRFFALPYGSYNAEVLEQLKLAGYDRVFTTDYGRNPFPNNNFILKRHHIKKTFSDEVFKKIIK